MGSWSTQFKLPRGHFLEISWVETKTLPKMELLKSNYDLALCPTSGGPETYHSSGPEGKAKGFHYTEAGWKLKMSVCIFLSYCVLLLVAVEETTEWVGASL